MVARHDGHAEIHFPPLQHHLEAAVLRHALFGDVQAGQHFQTRHHLVRGDLPRHLADAQHHAVDAVADQQPFLVRLQMDVAGAALQTVVERHVHQADHRAFVLGQRGQRNRFDRLGQRVVRHVHGHAVQHALGGLGLLQPGIHHAGGTHGKAQRMSGQHGLQLQARFARERRGHGQQEFAIHLQGRHAARHGVRQRQDVKARRGLAALLGGQGLHAQGLRQHRQQLRAARQFLVQIVGQGQAQFRRALAPQPPCLVGYGRAFHCAILLTDFEFVH
ncbi:hypothetical protein D3C87_1376950 [compost metagenome]